MATIYTVGHGARNTEALISILKKVGIETLLDLRFPKENLRASVADAGIAYDTAAFRAAAARLAARPERCCIMCAESNPEQCHRFHIADWLVGHGHRVVHLLALERAREHALHPQEDL